MTRNLLDERADAATLLRSLRSEGGRIASYRPGELLFDPSVDSRRLGIVGRGSVTMWRLSPKGKQLAIASLGSGEWFDNVFPAAAGDRTFFEAETPVTIAWLDAVTFRRLAQRHPDFTVELIRSQIRRLARVEDRASQTALDTVAGSVALAIKQMAEHHGTTEIRVTHEELAQRLGTVRESVSLAISKLRRAGVLAPAGRRKRLISILSPAKLDSFVGMQVDSGN